MRAFIIFFALVMLVTSVDQGSKVAARTLPYGQPVAVIDGYWDWELAENPGAAFSTLIGNRLVLTLIACGALIALGVAASRTRPEERLKRIALAMIAGGALGNLVDRVRDGAVTDFIRWRVHDHKWPIFNVADAALLVGAVLLVVAWRKVSPPRNARATIAA